MLKRIFKISLYFSLFYTLFGFFIFPKILKPQIIDFINKNTYAKISINNIEFNPFAFILKVNDIDFSDNKGNRLINFKSALLNLEPHSLFSGSLHIKNFILQKPELFLTLYKDKSINLLSIVKTSKINTNKNSSNKKFQLPRIIIDNASISHGIVHYKDFTQKDEFNFLFQNLDFRVKNLDTNDFDNSLAIVKFYTKLADGGDIKLDIHILGFKPLIFKGTLAIDSSKLYSEWKYLKNSLNFEIADGKLSFFAHYYMNLDDINSTKIYDALLSINNRNHSPIDKYK